MGLWDGLQGHLLVQIFGYAQLGSIGFGRWHLDPLWKSSQLLLSYCYSCYSSHLTYFDILGFPFQQSHSSQCSAKETPTSILWAKPREKQVLLRCLGFASRAEKHRKSGNPENLLWHHMTHLMTRWCDAVWTYLKTQLILMLNLCWPLHSLGVLEYSVSFPLECHHVTCFAVLWNENNMEFVWPRKFARLIHLDSLPQRCLRLILSERLSREALSRRKINFSPGEYTLFGHNSINLQDFIRRFLVFIICGTIVVDVDVVVESIILFSRELGPMELFFSWSDVRFSWSARQSPNCCHWKASDFEYFECYKHWKTYQKPWVPIGFLWIFQGPNGSNGDPVFGQAGLSSPAKSMCSGGAGLRLHCSELRPVGLIGLQRRCNAKQRHSASNESICLYIYI